MNLMDLTPSSPVPDWADITHMREAREVAKTLRGAGMQQVRALAEQGRMTRAELERLRATAALANGFSDAELAEQIQQAERSHADVLAARRGNALIRDAVHQPATRARVASVPRAASPPVVEASAAPVPTDQPAPRREVRPIKRRWTAEETAELIAQKRARHSRERVIAFLRVAGLAEEWEHVLAIEERLRAGTRPARYHAALSTRLLLKGVADRCFPARSRPWVSRSGRAFDVGELQVGNRLIAFAESALGSAVWNEDGEHRVFIANVDTLSRFSGRGPHRIYDPQETERFLLRVFEVLDLVARAYAVTYLVPGVSASAS